MAGRHPLQKVKGLLRLQALRLPTTAFRIMCPYLMDRPPGPVASFMARFGSVSIRTDCDEVSGGSMPFLFMERDLDKAHAFNEQHRHLYRIVCEAIPPEDVLVQAHVYLDEALGRWKLAGEANETCTRSCREAVAVGTRSSGLRDIWELEHHREYWARLRRLMLDAGLVGGEIAEVTICKSGRIVFWEV